MMDPSHIDTLACDTVQRIRHRMDWTYDTLATIFHASEATASNICNGRTNVTTEKLNRLFVELVNSRNPEGRKCAGELLRLITGATPIAHHFLDDVVIRDLSDPEACAALVDAQRENIEAFEAMLELLKGGVNPADPGELDRLRAMEREAAEAIDAMYGLMAALQRAFDRRSRRR